jgi:hypothetical protein
MEMNFALRFRDGRVETLEREPVIDLDAGMVTAHADRPVAFGELKAVFYLRASTPASPLPSEAPGTTLAVEFDDGEMLRGTSSDYAPDRSGFFLFPTDRSKIEKAFVISSAILSIEVEKF